MQGSSKTVLKKLDSAEVVRQNREYVRQRKEGEITSMKTKFTKLNNCLMGGIELDTITCISAMSGAGKSTLSKCFRDSFVALRDSMGEWRGRRSGVGLFCPPGLRTRFGRERESSARLGPACGTRSHRDPGPQTAAEWG